MIKADDFLSFCLEYGLKDFTGTPCSYLKPFINRIIEHEQINFYPSANEGDAVAFASGLWLGGKQGVVIFQNSGLGNAVNPLTSLNQISQIPLLGIVTLRGEPGGAADEPQHKLMGEITTGLLDLMEIPWSYFPTETSELKEALAHACQKMNETRRPYFFVMKKDSVEEYKLKNQEALPALKRSEVTNLSQTNPVKPIRTECLELIASTLSDDIPLVATTGKTGRELYEIKDCPRHFYLVGAMGCALSLGQGIVSAGTDKVCVLDGDGALMMRMGALTVTPILRGSHLLHILLDNEAHDSTGGQKTGSELIDFCQIARSCGYQQIFYVNDLNGLKMALDKYNENPNLTFIHIKMKVGSPEKLGRPKVTPEDVAIRFRGFLNRG